MKITIIAHPNSKKPRIEKDLMGTLHVYVNKPPLENKANEAVLEDLAKYLEIKKNQLILVSGEKSKTKTFEISG
jgi:uncharacterized protein YggU (UPF0235/DUF167 family)